MPHQACRQLLCRCQQASNFSPLEAKGAQSDKYKQSQLTAFCLRACVLFCPLANCAVAASNLLGVSFKACIPKRGVAIPALPPFLIITPQLDYTGFSVVPFMSTRTFKRDCPGFVCQGAAFVAHWPCPAPALEFVAGSQSDLLIQKSPGHVCVRVPPLLCQRLVCHKNTHTHKTLRARESAPTAFCEVLRRTARARRHARFHKDTRRHARTHTNTVTQVEQGCPGEQLWRWEREYSASTTFGTAEGKGGP